MIDRVWRRQRTPFLGARLLKHVPSYMADISKRDPEEDGADVFGRFRRRRLIAEACRFEARSVPEIATALDISNSGAVASVVRTLVAYGVLNAGSERRHGRTVAVYSLEPAWSTALDDALSEVAIGLMSDGQQVVIVPTSGLAALAGLLYDEDTINDIAWAAAFTDAAVGMVLVARPGRNEASTRLLVELQQRGVTASTHVTPKELLNRDSLRRWRNASLRILPPSQTAD